MYSVFEKIELLQWCCGCGLIRPNEASFIVLAIVNSRSLYAYYRPYVCRLSVYNDHAPYSGGLSFRQYFCGTWYLGHPLTST